MKISYVSSQAVSGALSYALTRTQAELMTAQTEAQTGKHADVGLALGVRAGQAVSLTRDLDRLSGMVDSNALVSNRLSATEDALSTLADSADAFLSTLTVGGSSASERSALLASGTNTLDTLTSIMNTSLNGEYLFAGINTDVEPVADYTKADAPARAALAAAFQAHFGFAKDDPAALAITADQMNEFLTGVVEPMFSGGDWQANWSSATDETIVSRISLNETARTSVSANSDGFRTMAMATSLVYDLLDAPLNQNARDALVGRARDWVAEAIADVNGLRTATGLTKSRVENASERINMQVDIFTKSLRDMEGVDPYEASTRVNDLLNQIETSYALTARIQQLSLLNFL